MDRARGVRAMEFWTWGPFEYRSGFSRSEFWESVAEKARVYGFDDYALRPAVGCYLFSTSRGSREIPWYIGKTIADTGFYGEIFTPHKIEHYQAALEKSNKLAGNITLFALATPGKKISYAGRSNKRLIDWLEKSLIGMGLSKNGELRNVKDTRYLKNVMVEGVIGPQRQGRPVEGARLAGRALR